MAVGGDVGQVVPDDFVDWKENRGGKTLEQLLKKEQSISERK